jgi:hypothetical protein
MTLSSTDAGQIRKFGIVAFVFFGVLSGIAVWRHKQIACGFLGVLSFLGLCFILSPGTLSPVYAKWLGIADSIGKYTIKAILALTYYLAITPTALIYRLMKGSPLPLRPDRSSSSYWIGRSEPAQPRERFVKRY